MSKNVEAVVKGIVYGAPGVSILFGCILLLLDHPVDQTNMVNAGWVLILAGLFFYFFVLVLRLMLKVSVVTREGYR